LSCAIVAVSRLTLICLHLEQDVAESLSRRLDWLAPSGCWRLVETQPMQKFAELQIWGLVLRIQSELEVAAVEQVKIGQIMQVHHIETE
jgi:hypothetical protein